MLLLLWSADLGFLLYLVNQNKTNEVLKPQRNKINLQVLCEIGLHYYNFDIIWLQVLKNDGEVYGEVREKEEVRLFGDKADHIKWYPKEEKCTVSGKKHILQILSFLF